MKSLIMSLLLILSASLTHAQKINFCDTSNVWHVLQRTEIAGRGHIFSYTSSRFSFSNTVLVDTQTYYQLQVSASGHDRNYGFVRFDSVLNKVLYRNNITDTDKILYDYTLRVGDTIVRPIHPHIGYKTPINHIVSKIDSVLINNTFHKRFWFAVIDSIQKMEPFVQDYQVVEGIGCLTTLYTPLNGISKYGAEDPPTLICFKNQNSTPPIFSRCKDSVLAISEASYGYNMLKAFPQPATKEVRIQLPEKITSGTFYILNTMGQIVAQQSINNSNTIKYNNNSLKGIYYYRIANNHKSQQYTGKLLFE